MSHDNSLSLGYLVLMVVLALETNVNAADRGTVGASILIRNVPHVRQKPDFCGEACVASWLQKLGADVDQDTVFDQSGLDPTSARGCYSRELATAIRNLGFQPGPIWNPIPVADHQRRLEQLWKTTHADLARGVPSIICMRTREGAGATEHFRLLLGYDASTDEVIYHEPATDNGAYHRMAREKLIRLWPLKYDTKEWTAVRFRLAGLASDRISKLAASKGPTNADYVQHIRRLQDRLPDKLFTIVLERPFVVIGDEDAERVRRRAKNTVNWATDRLKAEYFAKDPDRILDVWLFKDKDSYEVNAARLFRSKPDTPYGYYSPTDNALVMNIATGGGTLVHEIVHPFIEANFPECPSWFNEGLGSLYEQSASREDRIIGLTNWRLAGLQRAIRAERVPSFASLCSTTTNQFYREDPGTNYSQARYLCYYLQEHGLLRKFYHEFSANHADDPTGYKTLQAILGKRDMQAFQKKWKAYVLTLKF